jgi:hypothetical protein
MRPLTQAVFALALCSCSPEQVRYCHYVCIDKNVESTAESCGGERPKRGCEEPAKRAPVLGEEVTVVGLDPDAADDGESSGVQLLGRIEEIAGDEFVLDLEGRQGFLGGAVYGADSALIGIVQDERDGRMLGRAVE